MPSSESSPAVCRPDRVADPQCPGCPVCSRLRREFEGRGLDPDHEFETCRATGIRWWLAPFLADRLPGVEPLPSLLYAWGGMPPTGPAIAVVGSRRATAAGSRRAYAIGQELAAAGFQVVSGLARGIDGAVLEGAVAGGGQPIAVLGNGLPRIYPNEHVDLAGRIRGAGGVILTEYPCLAPPRSAHFPQRNRLISGLSIAVVLVEASLKSGSLITAGWAARQGRDVLAFPGPVEGTTHEGCHALIQDGVPLVTSVEDILVAIAGCLPGPIGQLRARAAEAGPAAAESG